MAVIRRGNADKGLLRAEIQMAKVELGGLTQLIFRKRRKGFIARRCSPDAVNCGRRGGEPNPFATLILGWYL